MNFKEFVKGKATEDNLPFDLLVKVDFPNAETQSVGGFLLPVLNDLTGAEDWFYRKVGLSAQQLVFDYEGKRSRLAIDFKKACNLDLDPNDAIALLFSPDEETAKSDSYLAFYADRSSDISDLLSKIQLIQNPRVQEWLRITYFLASRFDENWDLPKTAALKQSQIQEILAFITLEANKGIDPTSVVIESTEPSEGNELVPVKTGRKSTGS